MKTNTNIIAKGNYQAIVTGFAVRVPMEKDKFPYVVITFKTDDGHILNFFGSLKKDASLENDAYGITMKALARLGYKSETKATFDKDVIGRESEIVVEHKENEKGETIAYVKFVNGRKTYTKANLMDVLGDDDEAPAPKAVRGTTVKFS